MEIWSIATYSCFYLFLKALKRVDRISSNLNRFDLLLLRISDKQSDKTRRLERWGFRIIALVNFSPTPLFGIREASFALFWAQEWIPGMVGIFILDSLKNYNWLTGFNFMADAIMSHIR